MSVLGSDGLEPAVHRAVEHDAAGRGEHAAPDREVLVDVPNGLPGRRVPRVEPAPMTAGSCVHLHAGADVGRARDVVGLRALVVHAIIGVWNVEPPGLRRERAGRLVLAAGRGGTDASRNHARLGAKRRILRRAAGLAIDAVRPVGEDKLAGRDHFPGFAVERVDESIAVGMDEHFAFASIHLNVGENIFVDAVVVPGVVRRHLIGPARIPVIGVAREDGERPLVVPGPHVRIPDAGIGGAVVDQVQLWIVGDPPPVRAAAQFPLLAAPGLGAKVGAALILIEGLERGPDQHVAVGTRGVRAPQLLPVSRVQRLDPAAHAQLGAAVADDHFVVDDDRRHGHGLADVDIAHGHFPDLFAAVRVDRDGVRIQRVEVDPAVGVGRAAIHHVTARNADGLVTRIRLVHPLHRPTRLRQIDGIEDAGVGRDDVHHVVHDQRIALVAMQYAGRKRARDLEPTDVAGGDLVQRREARHGIIATGERPLLAGGCHDRAGIRRVRDGSRRRVRRGRMLVLAGWNQGEGKSQEERRPGTLHDGFQGTRFVLTYTTLCLVFLQSRAATRDPRVPRPAFVFVSNELARTVTVIDGKTHQPVSEIAVPGRPRGIAVSADGQRLYVALSDTVRQKAGPADGIIAIDVRERRIVDRLPAGTDPEQFAISADGRWVYASNEDAGMTTGIDLEARRIAARYAVGIEPEGVAISPDGRWVYVTGETSNTVSMIDIKAQRVVANLLVPARPRAVRFSRDGRRAFVTSEIGRALTVVDVARHATLATIAITDSGAKPVGVSLSPDEQLAYVATGRGNSVAVVDLAARKQIASIPVGRRPWGIAISPDGRTLYTANGLSGDVSVIDTATRQVVATIKAGAGAWGVAVSP